MKNTKNVYSVLMSVVATVVALTIFLAAPTSVNAASGKYGISSPIVKTGRSTWDTIYFGNYYQSNSSKKEPIRWRVLHVDGNDAFLMTENVIADQRFAKAGYGEEAEQRLWEGCFLRQWLNSEFFAEAFSEKEQNAIRETKVVNKDNFLCENSAYMEAGSDTYDRIYCLSLEEATDWKYGFDSYYREDIDFFCSDTREAKGTNYLESTHGGSAYEGNIDWWLRSPSYNGMWSGTCAVTSTGIAGASTSSSIYCKGVAVRPVLHLDLSKTSLWKKGKTVSAENSINLSCAHSFSSSINWDSDGEKCTVFLLCSKCKNAKMLDAKIKEKTVEKSTCTSTGMKKCTATVSYNGKKYTDYRYKYTDYKEHKLGKVQLISKAGIDYAGSEGSKCKKCGSLISSQISAINGVYLDKTYVQYDGNAHKPAVTVYDSKGDKINSKYYDVTYYNNGTKVEGYTIPGEYKVVVKFKGKYEGEKELTYSILENLKWYESQEDNDMEDMFKYIEHFLDDDDWYTYW